MYNCTTPLSIVAVQTCWDNDGSVQQFLGYRNVSGMACLTDNESGFVGAQPNGTAVQCLKTGSGVRNRPHVIIAALVALMFAAIGVQAAALPTNDTFPITMADGTSRLLRVGETTISGNEGVTLVDVTYGDGLSKRQCYGGTFTMTETRTQVVQTGTWDKWCAVSQCGGSYNSAGGGSISFTTGTSSSVSYSDNFDISVGGVVKDIINGNIGFSKGYTWEQTMSNSASFSCNIQGYTVTQIWGQRKVGWSNSQTRTCYTYIVCGMAYKTDCGDWSAYQHADWPLRGDYEYLGCSTGNGHVECGDNHWYINCPNN
jgi:hypothetical protein